MTSRPLGVGHALFVLGAGVVLLGWTYSAGYPASPLWLPVAVLSLAFGPAAFIAFWFLWMNRLGDAVDKSAPRAEKAWVSRAAANALMISIPTLAWIDVVGGMLGLDWISIGLWHVVIFLLGSFVICYQVIRARES